MLIISRFHDYYDPGMKLGVDKTVIYHRNTEEIKGIFPQLGRHVDPTWCKAVLGFCGKFYPFVFRERQGTTDRVIWDVEEAVQSIRPSKSYWDWDTYTLDSEKGIRNFFVRKYPELEELFHKHRTPIFGFEPNSGRSYSWRKEELTRTLVLNPCLKNIGFYRVKDTITAFQEIAMFISGVIGTPPKTTRPIDDKVIAASKGHDGEFSFRKPPGKRGKKQWR
jgi:hypothetical protein